MKPSRLLSRSRRPDGPREPGSRRGTWKAVARALQPQPVQLKQPDRPFFTAVRELLDQRPGVTFGALADAAGEQTSGLLVLLLTLPSLVPGLNLGTAPVGGLGIMALGFQMVRGRTQPWLPERVRRQPVHPGKMKAALARIEGYLARFGQPGRPHRTLSPRWMGLLVAWAGFLLFLPVPLPFGNQFPALTLLILGAALLEERPLWSWIGAAVCLANTLYFALSFHLIIRECARFAHALGHWLD